MQASYALAHTFIERCIVVRTGKSFINFPQATEIWQQWHCHSHHRSTTCHLGSREWSPHGAGDIHSSHFYAIGWPCLADVVCSSHQLLSDDAAHLVDPQLTLRALNEIVANTTAADSTEVLTLQTQNLFFNDMEYHPSLPSIGTLLGVCKKHQVISIEKLPWHISAELMQKHFQYQDGALMHTNPYVKLFTVQRPLPHTWGACPGWYVQSIHRHWGSSRPTRVPSMAPNQRLSQEAK